MPPAPERRDEARHERGRAGLHLDFDTPEPALLSTSRDARGIERQLRHVASTVSDRKYLPPRPEGEEPPQPRIAGDRSDARRDLPARRAERGHARVGYGRCDLPPSRQAPLPARQAFQRDLDPRTRTPEPKRMSGPPDAPIGGIDVGIREPHHPTWDDGPAGERAADDPPSKRLEVRDGELPLDFDVTRPWRRRDGGRP